MEQNKSGISARIIADSKNEFGQRLTTFVLTFPRIVLAEFNTHRMLSRNSASSRAIPFAKMLKMVQEDPFIPIKWMKDHKGMQGNEYITDFPAAIREKQWLDARDAAVLNAQILANPIKYCAGSTNYKEVELTEYGTVTKQIVNRLLEPFMWHTVIVTASEWENFFALRAHPDAEIHIQELAHKILEQYNIHAPKQLKAGEWHIPFGDNINLPPTIPIDAGYTLDEGVAIRKVKIATARCARVSYLNFEGKDDYEADIRLHDTLLASGHMSPFEHCARAMNQWEMENNTINSAVYYGNGFYTGEKGYQEGWNGNFRGFLQYRKMIQGENKSDNRVKK